MKIETIKMIKVEEEVQISENEKKTLLDFFERKNFYCSTYDYKKLADSIAEYYDENPIIELYDELTKEVPVLAKLKKTAEELDKEDVSYEKLFYIFEEYLKEVLSSREETKIVSKIFEEDFLDVEKVFTFLEEYDIFDGTIKIEIDPENQTATIKKI